MKSCVGLKMSSGHIGAFDSPKSSIECRIGLLNQVSTYHSGITFDVDESSCHKSKSSSSSDDSYFLRLT